VPTGLSDSLSLPMPKSSSPMPMVFQPMMMAPLQAGPVALESGLAAGRRRALTIGINYLGSKNELSGCINDSDTFVDILQGQLGFDGEEIQQLRDDRPQLRPTRERMLEALRWLVDGARAGDHLFFHYSGHGSQQACKDGTEEKDGMDDTIVPVDFEEAGQISDDELRTTIVLPLPAGVRLTAVLDCCHSGSALDLPYRAKHAADGDGLEVKRVGAQQAPGTPAEVVMISGCKDSQTSADIGGGGQVGNTKAAGAMSTALKAVIAEKPQASCQELLTRMRAFLKQKGYAQKPQLTSEHPVCLTAPFMPQGQPSH